MRMEMINGMVIKVTETHIVLLTEEGMFKNVPRPISPSEVPLIGQSYTHAEQKKEKYSFFKYGLVAAAFVLIFFAYFMLPLGGSAEEAFIVTVDINPSIEVVADEHFRVIRAEGLNEDGRNILSSLQLEEDLYMVMQQIIGETVSKGFMEGIENPLIATTVIPLVEESDELLSHLREAIDTSLNESDVVTEVLITSEKKELYEEAKESNLSINYYKEYKLLEANGIVKKQEEIRGKSLSELKKMEKQQGKEEKEQEREKEKEVPKREEIHTSPNRTTPASNQANPENNGKEPIQKEPQQPKENRTNQPDQAKDNRGNEPQPGNENKGNQPEQVKKAQPNQPELPKENKGNPPQQPKENGASNGQAPNK